MGKERKPVPRDPGKGFIPEESCRLKGTKDQGNTVPIRFFSRELPSDCPVLGVPRIRTSCQF